GFPAAGMGRAPIAQRPRLRVLVASRGQVSFAGRRRPIALAAEDGCATSTWVVLGMAGLDTMRGRTHKRWCWIAPHISFWPISLGFWKYSSAFWARRVCRE